MKEATDDVLKRVLKLVRAREADLGEEHAVDSLDLALLIIRYGSFLDEGFFKLLRNTGFAYALGASLLAGLVTWTILNIMILWGGG